MLILHRKFQRRVTRSGFMRSLCWSMVLARCISTVRSRNLVPAGSDRVGLREGFPDCDGLRAYDIGHLCSIRT